MRPLPRRRRSEKIDARFGTNEVERQLRIALRTAEKGDPAVAAELLEKVLAIEPINREALSDGAIISWIEPATEVARRQIGLDRQGVELIGRCARL